MKTFLITLRATALVDAIDHDNARRAWENGCERDVEIDTEGGLLGIEPYDEQPGATRPTNERHTNAEALDLITNLMSCSDWSPDTLDAIAEIVRSTGRQIGDTRAGYRVWRFIRRP